MQKESFVQYMERVLWLAERVKSGLQGFVLETSLWVMLHGQGDQLKFQQTNGDINWEQSMLFHVGIADIRKISRSIKLLVKMKNVFYFMEKSKWTFWPTQ